jgi:NitT/TauT family transport system ATP-binding protein
VLLSPRPARVVQVFETALPRPREPIATRELPRFVELRHALLERLLGR